MRRREPPRRLTPIDTLGAMALLLAAATASAGDWRITPRVTGREIYSDNIELAPPGFEKEDFVTEIRPGISIRGEGARLQGTIDYDAQALFYARGSSADELFNRLQALGTGEIVKDHLFLEGRATIYQENLTSLGRQSADNINVTNNLTNVYTFGIAPVYRQRFGSHADLFARAAYDGVRNDPGTDSDIYSTNLALTSGNEFVRLPWDIAYDRQRVVSTDGQNSTFRSVDGGLRYRIHRKYGLIGRLGYENNDLSGRPDTNDTSGVTWRAGGYFTPTERTSLEATYGRRFFGDFWQFDFSHRSRRVVLTASYNEDATTTSILQAQRIVVPLIDPFGNPILDPNTGDPLSVPIDTSTVIDEVVIRRRFDGGIAYQGRRSDATVGLYAEQRDYDLGDDETVYGVNLVGNRRLSSKTRVSLFGLWQESDLRSGRTDNRWNIGGFLRHNFLTNVDGSIEIQHTTNDSTTPSAEFEETRITGRLSMIF